MISQKCPKCRSSRIRKGYKPTPLLFRLVGIHYLLCNHCNLLFTGFAVPGTVGRPSHKSGKRDKEDGTLPRFSRPKEWQE
ncbi:MAG: hypothetical protein QOJ88_1481 [Pyrinomonadaceae bacterium]|jgi:hypothetical protein|nr:hypothetical protein [Pyrinomonadaceae bacterium]MDQ1729296.1 hypothetical protein [Pyrinomonadaceae bacterium]